MTADLFITNIPEMSSSFYFQYIYIYIFQYLLSDVMLKLSLTL